MAWTSKIETKRYLHHASIKEYRKNGKEKPPLAWMYSSY